MKCIPNFDTTSAFEVRQQHDDWCVLANVEAVTRYHNPTSTIAQHVLWQRFDNARILNGNPNEELGLISFTKQPLSTDEELRWAHSPQYAPADTYLSFDRLVSVLKKGVDEGLPYIISAPLLQLGKWDRENQKWHMLTIVGYDETMFRIYDSASSKIVRYCDVLQESLHRNLSAANQDVTDSLLLVPNNRRLPK
jgi:hypothetical protein